jgi:hypothetical protein
MRDMDLKWEEPCEAAAQVRVSRLDGTEVTVRLRLLGYDGCEFESDDGFALGEQVNIHIYRMGSIRARIASQQSHVIEAEFDKECSV